MYKTIVNIKCPSVKISGDGAPESKTSTFTTIPFTHLEDGDDITTVPTVHPIAITEGSESYELFATNCRDVFQEINSCNSWYIVD